MHSGADVPASTPIARRWTAGSGWLRKGPRRSRGKRGRPAGVRQAQRRIAAPRNQPMPPRCASTRTSASPPTRARDRRCGALPPRHPLGDPEDLRPSTRPPVHPSTRPAGRRAPAATLFRDGTGRSTCRGGLGLPHGDPEGADLPPREHLSRGLTAIYPHRRVPPRGLLRRIRQRPSKPVVDARESLHAVGGPLPAAGDVVHGQPCRAEPRFNSRWPRRS